MPANQSSSLLNKYLQAGLSSNTKFAYAKDLAHFKQWGGRIPANAKMLANYLVYFAERLSVSTLNRRLVAINQAHVQRGYASPTQHNMVKATLQGIKRIHGCHQRKVMPLMQYELIRMLDAAYGIKGARDKALLLIGFAAALRRSELVSLTVNDLRFVKEGLIIHISRSKTDQSGIGRDIAVPYVKAKHCPVKAVKQWLKMSGIKQGAIFPRIDRYGHIGKLALTPQAVAIIVKEYAAVIGIDYQHFSGHSLRVGMVTSAAKAGAPTWKIRQQTGHQSETMLQLYIRDGELFNHHPINRIWDG